MHHNFRPSARYALIAALPLIFGAATPLAPGMSYDFVMKTQGKQTGGKDKITMSGRGMYAGDEAKIEITEAAASSGGEEVFGGKGAYFIVKGGGKEMYLVNPSEKTYAKWDIATMFAGMSKMVNAVGGLVKMQMSDIRIDAQDMGAGETVQGYATRHIRMTQNYTMSVSMFGRKSVSRNESTTDYYIAPALKIANPFVSNSNQMAMISQLDTFNNPDYKNQMMAANAKIPKSGVPLRTITTSVVTDSKGKAETSVTTMEMLNFKASNISPREFAIPSEYKLIEMPSVGQGLAGNTATNGDKTKGEGFNADSVAAAAKEGAKEGIKDAARDEARKATAKKLKGIFKR